MAKRCGNVFDMEFQLRLCRFCMTENELLNIFNVENEIALDFKAVECNLVNIKENDGLPSFICKLCTSKLNQCYDFKLQCINTELKLRKLISIQKDELHLSESKKNRLDADLLEEINCEPDFFSDYDDGLVKNDTKKSGPIKKKCRNHKKKDKKKQYINENDINKPDSTGEENLLNELTKNDKCESTQLEKDDKCNNPIDLRVLNLATNKTIDKLEDIGSIPLKPFQCELCGVTFKLKSILKKHFLTHSSEKLFACPLCPKRYTREEHRVVHMRSHAGFRPYVCEICARSFTKGQDLIRHKRIHSEEKNFSCMRCDKKFKRSSDVRAHMRTHTGATPYTCNNCYKTYASPSGLRKHKNSCVNKKKQSEIDNIKFDFIKNENIDCEVI